MDKKVKEVQVRNLVPGMILAKDIIIDGKDNLKKDMILNSECIEEIKKIGESYKVYVYDNKYNEKINKFIKYSIKNINKKEKIFDNISIKLDDVYRRVGYNPKLSITELRDLQKEVLEESKDYGLTMKSIIKGRDEGEYLQRHCVNVGILSLMIGKWAKLLNKDIINLTYAALLHDIGKMKIDDKILCKKSKLTAQEFKLAQAHTVIGYEIVKGIPYLDKSVSMGVLMHHERCDGSGYPLKLKGENIHVFGKIIAIADEFDAMTSNRVYKKQQSPFVVLKKMKEESLTKLDYNYFTTFLKGMIDCYVGEMVRLSDGKVGKIISMDVDNILKPLVLVQDEFIDLKYKDNLFVETLL